MSKRRSGRPRRKSSLRSPAPGAAPNPSASASPSSAADGYTNPMAFLGAASGLLSSGTFIRSGLTRDTELLTTLYRESWLAKKIIDMPAEDMTRAWYSLSASVSNEETAAFRALEARHSVRNEITNAIRWARLYGGSLALMVIRGEESRLDQPLDLSTLYPGCFEGLLVVDRSQSVEPSLELVEDLEDPDYGLPAWYEFSPDPGGGSAVRVHHSRVLRFVGRELPSAEAVRENYWGASELEHIWDELQKRSAVSANIAQLVFQANITTLKMSDFGEILAVGTENQRKRVLRAMEEQNRLRTSFGLQIISAEDSIENHPYSFAGLSGIYSEFMMDMSGAAEIPATRLFGRSPQGMNATGESDLVNYYERISQLQETYLRPALERLLPVLMISAFGYAAEDAQVVFEPIASTTPAERVDIASRLSSTLVSLCSAGIISPASALEELRAQGRELGIFSRLRPPEPAVLQSVLHPADPAGAGEPAPGNPSVLPAASGTTLK